MLEQQIEHTVKTKFSEIYQESYLQNRMYDITVELVDAEKLPEKTISPPFMVESNSYVAINCK